MNDLVTAPVALTTGVVAHATAVVIRMFTIYHSVLINALVRTCRLLHGNLLSRYVAKLSLTPLLRCGVVHLGCTFAYNGP